MIESQLNNLQLNLKRVFALPISKTTFREAYNAVLSANDKPAEANAFMETLLNGTPTEETGQSKELVRKIIDEFSIPLRVAREVELRGEYLAFINSQIIKTHDQIFLFNIAKTIDGKEFNFLTDLETTLTLFEHFGKRLEEFRQQGNITLSDEFKKRLQNTKSTLEKFLA